VTSAARRKARETPVERGSRLTLGDALPREMVRVACEVLPAVARRGDDGKAMLDAICGAMRLAGFAMVHSDASLMRRAHAELLDFQL
jgi:hypothetical protein